VAPVLKPEGGDEGSTHRRDAGSAGDLLDGLEGPFIRLTDAFADLKILGSVGSDRMQLWLRRLLARALAAAVLGVIALVLVVAGALLLASGVAGGLRSLFVERPWLGEIVAGLTLLATVATVWFAARARFERATTRRLEEKYAEMERKRSPVEPGPDSGGSPGPGRRSGARASAG
jgi:hypothetical protein